MSEETTVKFNVTIQAFKAKAGDFLWLFEDYYQKPRKAMVLQDVDTGFELECPVLIDSSRKVVSTLYLFQTEEGVAKFVTQVNNVHNQYHNLIVGNIQLSKNVNTK